MPKPLTDQIYQLLLEEGLQPDYLPAIPVADTPTESEASTANPLQPHEPIHTLRLPVRGKHAEWMCLVRIFEQTERVLVYSILPAHVPTERRHDVALMLTQINYGLILGNFELDLQDGEVRYKTSLDIEAISLNATVLRNLLYGNFFSLDMYYHALIQAIETDHPIEQLIYQAEHPNEMTGFDLVDDIVH
ncbi:MAG: YbjN domain-containing protein [Pseudomonadota bacterium]|nr:YbjN domain-containing protein [Pseudomonadota bacterium]